MPKNNKSLPPGVDDIDQDVNFGQLWIKIGTLKLLRASHLEHKVQCTFWGESEPSLLSVRSDLPNNQEERTQRYNIKCPVTFFAEYLQDVGNKLVIEVINVGLVSFSITKFLKKNVNVDSKCAFQNFKGFFQVIGKGEKKLGSLQIQMGCNFDPEIAHRELGEEVYQNMYQSIKATERNNCPAQKLQVKSCCGKCECICPPQPRLKQKKQEKKVIEETADDKRIAHSLDTKPREQSEYAAEKYLNTRAESKIKQQNEGKIKEKLEKINGQPQQFHELPKILTYSNLRLNYDDPELKQQMARNESEEQYSEARIKIPKKSEPAIIENRSKKPLAQQERLQQQPPRTKPALSPEELMHQFYGQENSPTKSKLEEEPMRPVARDRYSQVSSKEHFYQQREPQQDRTPKEPVESSMPDRVIDASPFSRQKPYHFQQMRPTLARPAPKKTNLLLNLFVEISRGSIQVPEKEGILIAYKPYGQKKDRLILGPHLAETITIMNTIGQSEVRMMGKTPFILQFWNSSQNKFLGLIRLSLKKINSGFMLEGRLNEIAIKTSLLPTTIHRGDIHITGLDEKPVGQCSLYAGIGTSNQFNLYLNQKQNLTNTINTPGMSETARQPQHPTPSKQHSHPEPPTGSEPAPFPKQHSPPLLECLDQLMRHLYTHNSRIIGTLNKHMQQHYIRKYALNALLKQLDYPHLQPIYGLFTAVSGRENLVDFHAIAGCFDDYVDVYLQMREELGAGARVLRGLVPEPAAVLTRIREHAGLQSIGRKKLQELLLRQTHNPRPICEYLNKLNQYISIEYLTQLFTNKHPQMPPIELISQEYMDSLIGGRVVKQLREGKARVHQIQQYLGSRQALDFVELWKWFHGGQVGVSLWALFHWLSRSGCVEGGQSGELGHISMEKLHQVINDVLASQHQKISEQQQQQEAPNNAEQTQRPQGQSFSQVDSPSVDKQPRQPQQPHNSTSQLQHQHELQHQMQPNSLPSISKQPVVEPESQHRCHKHLFTIQPIELGLEQPMKGNCVVVYSFPFDEQQIKSRSFATSIDKHKYPLKMYGTHGFTIEETAEDYLGDNAVKFYVKIDDRIEYEGALASDQLMGELNSEETKVIPLFGTRSEGIAGKIRLTVMYERALATDNMLGKQTTYQLFLPKTGFLNYCISTTLQPAKIRSQLNLKQQFYIALVLDIFRANASLKDVFPAVSSKLYSDSSENAELEGSVKISLGPVVLEYLKSSSARLSLNIIYYSKESGNFQRKEVPYATIDLPLMNAIKPEGVRGDYAFKNKLGMYVTLANCQIRYDKDPIAKSSLKQNVNKPGSNYWVILSFLEFINFEAGKFSWIKMEFVLRGKKYSTEKQHLDQYAVNSLQNCYIVLKFSEEDFIDTKVIPITIVTNTSHKLAIDINLKAIGRDLNQKKYSVNNQYYVVVNEQSRPSKMRVGLKSYCFKGGPVIANFVNLLSQNLNFEIFDEMELPEQMDNYDQMLNLFRNRLKLTAKAFNEVLSEIALGRSKQKLNFELLTNRTYYKLDFTPIIAESESEIDFICEDISTEAAKEEVLAYLGDNKIKLQNFRVEFLDRFYFKNLNKFKADKNVEFLGIDNQVDIISFVRKIKLLDENDQGDSIIHSGMSLLQKQVELTILEGANFHNLYNGIKPNAIVRVPDLGFQTAISARNSNPYFNESLQLQPNSQNLTLLRNLKIQVYHCTSTQDDDDIENMLIGEGHLNITQADLKNQKIVSIVLASKMSSKSKAALNVKVATVAARKNNKKRATTEEQFSQLEDSADVSRFGQIIHDIHKEVAYKNKLFESSDDDY